MDEDSMRSFRFENQLCECMVSKSSDGNHKLLIQSIPVNKINRNKKATLHKFVFSLDYLGLIEETKKTKKYDQEIITPITKLWDLGEYDDKYAERLCSYINTYGFFWPVPKYGEKAHEIRSYDLYLFINRLRRLHELFDIISNISEHTDYNRLFELTFYYIFAVPVTLELKHENRKNEVTSCSHFYGEAWWHPSYVMFDSEEPYIRDYTSSFLGLVKRSDSHYHIQRKLELNGVWANNVFSVPFNESENVDEVSARIGYFADKLSEYRKEIRLPAKFLHEFVRNVCKITKVLPNGVIQLESDKKLVSYDGFGQILKNELIQLAKKVYAEELSWGLQNISPRINANLELVWNIPDFLSALYLSHFYITPKSKMLRKCKNPQCPFYFSVNRSKHNKIYCSACSK